MLHVRVYVRVYVLGIGVLGLNAAGKAKVVLCSDSNEYVDEVFDKCADTLPEVLNTVYTTLHNIMPYSATLYCAAPYYSMLHYAILYDGFRYCTTPHYSVQYHAKPYFTVLYHTILNYTILCYTKTVRDTPPALRVNRFSYLNLQGDQDKVFYENLTAEESIEQGKKMQLIYYLASKCKIQ